MGLRFAWSVVSEAVVVVVVVIAADSELFFLEWDDPTAP